MSSEEESKGMLRLVKAHGDVFHPSGAILWQKELTLNSSRGTSEEQMSVDMKTFLALVCLQNGIHVPLSFPSRRAECTADRHPCQD